MADPTPEQLAMASKIVQETYPDVPGWTVFHKEHAQTALAAIIETSERAARWHEKRMEDRFAEHGTRESDTNATYYSGRYGETLETLDEEDEAAAAALRNMEHLHDEHG